MEKKSTKQEHAREKAFSLSLVTWGFMVKGHVKIAAAALQDAKKGRHNYSSLYFSRDTPHTNYYVQAIDRANVQKDTPLARNLFVWSMQLTDTFPLEHLIKQKFNEGLDLHNSMCYLARAGKYKHLHLLLTNGVCCSIDKKDDIIESAKSHSINSIGKTDPDDVKRCQTTQKIIALLDEYMMPPVVKVAE